jgi:hypothetical protein
MDKFESKGNDRCARGINLVSNPTRVFSEGDTLDLQFSFKDDPWNVKSIAITERTNQNLKRKYTNTLRPSEYRPILKVHSS